MARTRSVLGSGARLSDFLSASLLARVVPAEQVNAALDEYGCNSQRLRSFPAVVGVYYCMALNLYPEAAYEEVFSVVAQGLAWAAGTAEPARVAKSSISAARSRIGWQPLATLVERCCNPLADPQANPQAFYAGLRLVAMDGSNFELPDEADNAAQFGYPGSRTGHAGYPQAQCAVLVECATHAILGANIGPYRASEWESPLLNRLIPILFRNSINNPIPSGNAAHSFLV
ncbi:transposase domain-containing protein [Nitrosomonas sp. Nm166]|uniref:transposase domain-containing protein n=1 Tax=Nitrosomonas sp. Nm166 TaxID=1881054 RepID=UPI0008E26E15|nr:transposase domain-containing protein [Nitrosomonas sp. Nm166]SFF27776.1 Insertion element 4 transposase N-terminal [Nitrosomonas sp. Nm166]